MFKRRAFPTVLIASVFMISCAGTQNLGAGLWGSLGGGSGVSALANSFASNLQGNAAASQALGGGGIESAKKGLYNSIAKTGGYAVEKGSDLTSVMKDMNLSPDAVNAVGESLTAAMAEQSLKREQKAAVSELWKTATKSLSH